jgi:two-component system NtrC family sensor kinase
LLRHSLSADARFVEDELLIAGEIHSEVAIPLRVKRRIIGTLSMSSRQVGAYEPDCLTTAQSMADQLAAAIENARLHEDLQARLDALHEAQARLVQSEKLAALGELVAGVAHELNNPLTSIFGYAQLMQFGVVSQETRNYIDRIVVQTRHATSIIRALLDFARQRPPERKPTQINNVLASTLDLLGYELRHANVTWTTHFSSDVPVTMADPHQLQQVFVNVVNNARQAMHDAHQGGHLTITAEVGPSAFIKDQSEAAPVIHITFRDDGSGIPPDALPHIFDPFFTTKSSGGGTGLGLSICHGIVSEHGGHIWAESQSGEGATFFIELPIVAAESV